MEEIKEWLNTSSGSGSGYGYGSGDGSGDGHGYGSGDGYGYGSGDGYGYGYGYGDGYGYGYGYGYGDGYGSGYGSGSGDGYGYGSGDGSGDGHGYGSGDGYGYGYGYGSGDGSGISSFNHNPVYMIDDVPTLIDRIRHGFAIGHVLRKDFTLAPCVVAKSGRFFAHGETIRKALEALQDKLFYGMTEDERIAAFWKCHNRTDAYSGHDLYDWHHKLTGSCEFGRQQFVSDHGLSLDAMYTVDEFIKLCENDYGGSIISRLKEDGDT